MNLEKLSLTTTTKISEIKISMHIVSTRLDIKEGISDLKEKYIEIMQTNEQRDKKVWKKNKT